MAVHVSVHYAWRIPAHLRCTQCSILLHLALWHVVLVYHQYDICENYVGSVYIGGYGGLSESTLCVFRKLCPVSFLVVGECPSVLL